MASAALFVGWGLTARGREREALQLFNEAIQYYTGLQQQGTIESFETVILEPHGGDLSGFVLLRGEPDKLSGVRTSEEFQHFTTRAILSLDNVGITGAYIGDGLNRLITDYEGLLR